MLKSKFKKVAISVAFIATSLVAESGYAYNINSLFGLEGGYSGMISETTDTTATPAYSQNNSNLGHFGVKLGAESEDVRVFLSARTFSDIGDKYYSNMYTYGGELQYIFNPLSIMNIYLGVNAGQMEVSYTNGNSFSTKMSEPYIGADIGTNIHMGKGVDLELGVRMMSVEAMTSQTNVEYKLNNLTTGYASLIFKWKMD